MSLEHIRNYTSNEDKSSDLSDIERLKKRVQALESQNAQLTSAVEQLAYELSEMFDYLVKHPQERNDTLEASAENIYRIRNTVQTLYESLRLSPDEHDESHDESDEFIDLFK